MIVNSIRLRNIKSYGAGPGGQGVTVALEPGVNRIAGVNGCGKTTIVEAIGYALFGASPLQFVEENFRDETYLVAQGEKAGEIDVTFTVNGASYRLERGVGRASKRRSKVVDLADGSICAEGDREVANFLASLLKLPSPDRLRDLFSKLVGVKQGRLAAPFDSTPKNAKDFFEPLLEVEVFGQCFGGLKPVLDAFGQAREEREKRRAVLDERLRERADAGGKLEAARFEAENQAARLRQATDALKHARQERERHEGLERAVNDAAREREAVAADTRLAAQGRQEAEARVRESEGAVEQVAASERGCLAYRAAEESLKALEERRKTRDALQRERERLSKEATALQGKRDAAREGRDLLLRQQEEKRGTLDAGAAELAVLDEALAAEEAAFTRGQDQSAAVAADGSTVAAWVKSLPGVVARMKTIASQIADAESELGGWDAEELDRADGERRQREAVLRQARDAAAKTEARIRTLREQLERLAGGCCPFLGERCEQFDPAKVRDNVSHLEGALVEERRAAEEARVAYEEAETRHARLVARENQLQVKRQRLSRDLADYGRDFLQLLPGATAMALSQLAATVPGIPAAPAPQDSRSQVSSPARVAQAQDAVARLAEDAGNWWAAAQECVGRVARDAALARTERTQKEMEARNLAGKVASLHDEVRQLGGEARRKEEEAGRLDAEFACRARDVAALEDSLKPFEGIDAELGERRRAAEAHKADYETWLRARPLADQLEGRRGRVNELKQEELRLAAALSGCEERLGAARAAFDRDKLAEAKAWCDKCSGEVAGASAHLEHAREERGRQEVRFAEWQDAAKESGQVQGEIARLDAAMAITDLARKTLRDAAPAVAKHLCARIARHAQAVYNQINPDPLELQWDSTHYSLRISPGDRRFAMLSGGEQTKLALAMTLAMVEEFSGLRFCIFDEPTYGVDADSRRKLADAILQLRRAAGLDQLLLVSHDDAFEGEVEHTVLLTRSAAGGTSVQVQ